MSASLVPMQETQFQSLGWGYPPEKEAAAHFRVFAGKLHGQSSLAEDSLRRVKATESTCTCSIPVHQQKKHPRLYRN